MTLVNKLGHCESQAGCQTCLYAQISRITLDFLHAMDTLYNTLRKRTLVQRNYCMLGLSLLPDRRHQATDATLTKQ